MHPLSQGTMYWTIFSGLLCLASLVHAGPTVDVLNGTYAGYHLPATDQDVFLGMPYAQPPVDYLRFKGPQSLNSTWNGTRTATEYSSVVSWTFKIPC